MIIIDTNVISELLRPTPDPAVEAWLGEQDGLSIYLTAISEAELRYGVAIMTSGKRRDGLGSAIARILRDENGNAKVSHGSGVIISLRAA